MGAHTGLLRWAEQTGKPYGAYGVSVGVRGASADPTPDFPANLRRAIEGAAFLFTRETRSITDEAASLYRQARAVVSMECHSPIMACVNGRPAFYVRQPHDTWKGQMYRDLASKNGSSKSSKPQENKSRRRCSTFIEITAQPKKN